MPTTRKIDGLPGAVRQLVLTGKIVNDPRMNILKVALALALLSVSLVLCLWAAGFIDGSVAGHASRKIVLIIGILGTAFAAAFLVLGSRRSGQDTRRPPSSFGPNF